ncbi:DUF1631 family protein [Aestuariirhabdus litorea]|uniref:DUF1631 family protein n=1 Tax=Aestuariirhabdus litorea TaxID=2528527 RepID=A0A3P3VLC3_9GAMM|nr:DUF1631 family protein [Aestuariirhabdus litorea]RRJ83551.1 DUF1631 family protein [Aestuariirhabdus litorea]RWW96772.1 DUF1631 family protein [Endozoicomonadaceae bacterium GTF-13]
MRDERRTSVRIPFNCRAQLMVMGHSALGCRVSDLCSGGFYLTQIMGLARVARDPLNPMVEGAQAEVLVYPTGVEGEVPLRFSTFVRRIEQDSLGVELAAPGSVHITSLIEMARNHTQQVAHETYRRPPQPSLAVRSELVARLRPSVDHSLSAVLDDFFESASSRLLTSAGQASNNTEQSQYFDLMGELKKSRQLFSRQIMRQLLEAWDAFAKPVVVVKEVAQQHPENDLSVVDKDEFEDWLAINVMVSNAEAKYRQQVEWLQARLSVLAGRDLEASSNPFSPDYLYACMQGAVGMITTTSRLQKELYKIFELAALPRLGELYAVFNEQLKAAGVLPDIEKRRKERRQGAAQSRQEARAESPHPHQQVPEADPAPHQQRSRAEDGSASLAALESIQNLLAWRRASATVAPHAPKGAANSDEFSAVAPASAKSAKWSQVELMAALTVLQGQLRDAVPQASGQDLRDQLASTLSSSDLQQREFSDIQKDCLDIVDSLFEVLMNHHDIPERIQPWLKAQQVPLLKVLVQDQSFFNNPQHPARQVLNKMARLAAAPSGSVESMQKTLKGYCDRIITEYDRDPGVYDEVRQELDKLESRQLQAIDRNTQRLVRSYDGQQKLKQAKQVVGCEIDLRIGGRRVPPVVMELLDIGLRDAMVLTFVRESVNSETWHELWQLFDQLLEWLGVCKRREVGAELERSLETAALLEMVERYLEIPAVDPFRRDQVIEQLQQALLLDPSAQTREDWIEVPVVSTPRDDREHSEETESVVGARWRLRAKRLQVGDWLGQIDSADRSGDIKLAWIGDGFSTFVFVNRQGLKAVEYELDELAQAMSEGLQPVDHRSEDSLLDQGIFNIVQNVYRDMAYQTSHDQLTGLLSRKAFEKQLQGLVFAGHQAERSHALCYIDVDLFKVVNNNCGTEAGDQLLQEVALTLGEAEHPILLSGRVGGNEFAVVFEGMGLEPALLAAESLRSAVESMEFSWGDKRLPQTVSIGVVEINTFASSAADLLHNASAACMKAKEGGRNQVIAFQPGAEFSRQSEEMAMLALVQRVLEEELLELRCQRIQNLASPNAPGHYEVLLSVRNAEGDDIPLEDFIRAAEKHNRMAAVDRWVIRTLFQWIADHPLQAELMGSFSVNLSGNSLNDNRLMDYILEQFSAKGVAPERICFEVTETSTITHIAKTADLIRELKRFGCRFSLDDFGTGLSSFAYLKQLPVDYLKIDGVFIKEIARSPVDFAMVRSIKEVGHFMGMEVIAEYAESDDVLRCLREIGVDYAQGYAVEKPQPLSYFREYFSDPVFAS